MSHDATDAGTGVPAQFERNRYFHGKLMTARDMTAEQDYLRRRLAALSRGVLGAGVVTGLAVTGVEEHEGDLRVTVAPGVALDAAGRTVVVPEGAGGVTVRRPGVDAPFPAGEVTDEGVALTLQYDHCSTERVPAPGNEHADGDGGEYGRVVETFVVEAEPVETGGDGREPPKPVPEVSLPGPDEDPSEAGRRMAAESFVGSAPGTPLVLATVGRDGNGDLEVRETPRPLVYPNDLVYATAVTHATDRENPHGVEVGQVEGAVASVGGARPDAEGAVAVRSDSDAVTVGADGDALVFDSDALRSVDVEGSGTVSGDESGRIGLRATDPSIVLSTDGNRIGLRADALRSIAVEGEETVVVGSEDRRVTLHSPDGSVAIATNEAGDRVGFAVDVEGDADLEGVLRELQGLADHGGAIEFVSSNDSVVVEPFEDEEAVLDVRVTEEFRERLIEESRRDVPDVSIEDLRDRLREDLGGQLRDDLRDQLRDDLREEVEVSLADEFEELRRTNETLSNQVARLSERTDADLTPVTTIEGVSLSNANALRELGIVTVGDLAGADAADLARISGVGEATANDWRSTAIDRVRR